MIRTVLSRGLLAASLAAGFTGLVAVPASAQSPSRVQVGVLECNGSKSVSFIIGSKRTLECTFRAPRGKKFSYEGSIRRWGLDIGVTGRNTLVWSVLAPSRGVVGRDLDGTYVGVAGSVALGVGVAGNVLVGGSNKTIALQPVSVEGQTGVNLAVGVGDLRLVSK
ncbi:DUF992 domain-containing protein [Ancylobacter amanitiformis]|uniref:DUF992 domain-containing protein n=1 Tax=Ancylobacter amanitiformis TaxID=217069 RepID=A0ABU0LLH4_9HYPH|nr:DUF992 domain-containing protein [Ancylobacter amanitiformis]MDQ0509554.1 hypothetical protein [Ancylobacter amanitiformis]